MGIILKIADLASKHSTLRQCRLWQGSIVGGVVHYDLSPPASHKLLCCFGSAGATLLGVSRVLRTELE